MVVGGGGQVFNGYGKVLLQQIRPSSNLGNVEARASEQLNPSGGYEGDWFLKVYAVCATPPPGLQLVSADSEPDSDVASKEASCPAGKYLLGTGGEIRVPFAGAQLLDDLRPSQTLKSVTVTAQEHQFGDPFDWYVTAHAICANY
jgi:hypothetical protein